MVCLTYTLLQTLIGSAQRFERISTTTLSSAGKESTCNAGDPSLIPGLGIGWFLLPGEGLSYPHQYNWASLVAQLVKNCLQQETWVQSLGWEDPLEEGMATHSKVLSWRIPTDRGAWRATVHGVAKSQTWLSTNNYKRYQNHVSFSYCASDSGQVGGHFEAYWETEFIKVDLQWWLATNLEIRIPTGRMG